MAQEIINVGGANEKQGDTPFVFCPKINRNFTELFAINPACINYIYEESDFPVQDATTITLEADVAYCLCAMISTGKSFIVEDSSYICGVTQTVPILEYTGTGVMFTSSAVWTLENLGFTCPNGTVFSHTGAGAFIIMRNSTCSDCLNIGNISSSGFFSTGSSFVNITGAGLTFTGANNGFLYSTGNMITSSASATIVDFGTATFFLMRVLDSTYSGPPGAIAFSGLPNGANINSGNKGVFEVNDLQSGGITPMVGMDPSDVRMAVRFSDGLMDSRNAADMFLIGGSETIPVGSSGDWNEIGIPSGGGVSWDSDITDRFTIGTNGVLTYIGEDEIEVTLTGRATIEKVGGGSNILEVRFAINWDGTVTDGGLEKSRAQTQNTDPTTVPIGALTRLSEGDDIRVIFNNTDGSSDIIASIASVEVSD